MRRVQIRKVATLGTGHTPSRSVPRYWVPDECTIQWLTLADVWQVRDGSRTVVTETREKISPTGVANSSAVVHPAGTVAFSRTASVGFSCILGTDMATSQDWVTWSCGPDLDPRYLLWVLRGEREQILGRTQGSTHKTIYMPDIEELTVPLPPVEEQREIAAFLDVEADRIDQIIATKTRMIGVLGRRWLSMLEVEVFGGSWPRRPLRRMLEQSFGGTWGSDPGEDEIDVLCVRGTDFDFGALRTKHDCPIRSVSRTDVERRSLKQGDLVIEKSGGGEKQPVGRTVVNTLGDTAVPTNFVAGLRPLPDIDSWYLAFVLRALYEAGLTVAWVKQTTGIQNLDLGGLLSEWVPCPPIDEQQNLVKRWRLEFERVQELTVLLQQQIGLLQRRRGSLIAAAVIGETKAA